MDKLESFFLISPLFHRYALETMEIAHDPGFTSTECDPANGDDFLCANQVCISSQWVCNNKTECGDNSDESPAVDCENRTAINSSKVSTRLNEEYFLIDLLKVVSKLTNCSVRSVLSYFSIGKHTCLFLS